MVSWKPLELRKQRNLETTGIRKTMDFGNHWNQEATGIWKPLEFGNHWNLETIGFWNHAGTGIAKIRRFWNNADENHLNIIHTNATLQACFTQLEKGGRRAHECRSSQRQSDRDEYFIDPSPTRAKHCDQTHYNHNYNNTTAKVLFTTLLVV